MPTEAITTSELNSRTGVATPLKNSSSQPWTRSRLQLPSGYPADFAHYPMKLRERTPNEEVATGSGWHHRDSDENRSAVAAGSACTNRIDRLTVTAP